MLASHPLVRKICAHPHDDKDDDESVAAVPEELAPSGVVVAV